MMLIPSLGRSIYSANTDEAAAHAAATHLTPRRPGRGSDA
jgi:hypothetical protein